MAYAVGLLATDGCLGGGKTVTFTSKDLELVETYRRCVGTDAPVRRTGPVYRVQITDMKFYRWLESIGVTPRKSLTLGALDVPAELMSHTVRGLLDGDGSVLTPTTIPNRKRYPDHRYHQLRVLFHSASRKHIDWLRGVLRERLGVEGWVTAKYKKSASKVYAPLHVLRYSKHESVTLLGWLYSVEDAPRLGRKWMRWVDFRDHRMQTRRYRISSSRSDLRELNKAGVAERHRRAPQERLGESPLRVRIPPPAPTS